MSAMPEHSAYENLAPHSVMLATNAKGKVTAEVKAYGATPIEAADAALATLEHVKKKLGYELAGASWSAKEVADVQE